MTILSKICGITTLEAASVAVQGGVNYLGFIHFAKSPRHLSVKAMTQLLTLIRADGHQVPLVCVVVDPSEAVLDDLMTSAVPDVIQLHGHETVERVAQIRTRYGIPVIKAISVENADDIVAAKPYDDAADMLLFDAKVPAGAAMPGGLGLSFDWTLMRAWGGTKPWLLAGGLSADNVTQAVRQSGAPGVDVSSGLETAPGVKDKALISGFLKTVKSL